MDDQLKIGFYFLIILLLAFLIVLFAAIIFCLKGIAFPSKTKAGIKEIL